MGWLGFGNPVTRRARCGPRLRTTLLLAATVLLLGLPGGHTRGADRDDPPAGEAPAALYAAPDERPYAPLDPYTLADRPAAAPLDFGDPWPIWALSGDGSTLVVVEGRRTVVVRDGLRGPERVRFDAPVAAIDPRLSHDGSRLVTANPLGCGTQGCSRSLWHVFDTRDGRLLATVEDADQPVWPDPIDPAARRLYRPVFDPAGDAEGPWPLQIVAYDLATGAEVGRLALPAVRAGTWYVDAIDQAPVADVLRPAVALSPDGSRLAVVHADADRVTLIDAATLTVVATREIERPDGFPGRLLRRLGVAPTPAAAKYLDGRSLRAVFAPDGRHLYLFGDEGSAGDGAAAPTARGLGLRLIALDTGEVVAAALPGASLADVLPAPDGRAVYVSGPTVPWTATTGEPSYRLRRLDARTLQTLAEREFPNRRWVVLVPDVGETP